MDYNSAALDSALPQSAETRLVIGPNASLSVRQAWLFMGITTVFGLGIALGMAFLGFWPVIPFAGLELGALGAALYLSVRRNGYREVVVIDAHSVRVEFGMQGRGALTTFHLQRGPARVLLESGPHRHAPSRLLLSSCGQVVRLGACLTDDERLQLAARIKQLLTPAWTAPLSAHPGRRFEQETLFGE
jgi:uncharacterized membrane protein